MDPNTTLSDLLSLAKDQITQEDTGATTDDTPEERAAMMAELVSALDSWIVKGGFLPRRWQPRT